MNVFELTRALVDINSITENEAPCGEFLCSYLQPLANLHGGTLERMPVTPERFNILVTFGKPLVTLSTHYDTVPPFIPSREDDERIWGRGACDTKGIIASMIFAARALLEKGHRDLALFFVVGEEQGSVGAMKASEVRRGSRYLINGEPTENKLALGSKGALRFEILASGRSAHSAYPHLGDSAILKLLDALERLRRVSLPVDEVLGPSTLNIGTLSGGEAPNVIPSWAKAEIFIRLVEEGDETARQVMAAMPEGVEAREILRVPALRLKKLDGFETDVMAYTTDIPVFKGAWGEPCLLGPGTIHVAHTPHEHIPKKQILEAIEIYQSMVLRLHEEANKI
jgi:acetylornithine deacetylase